MDFLIIFLHDFLNFLIEVRVVVREERLVTVVTVDDLRTERLLHLLIIIIWRISTESIHLPNIH